MSLIDKFPGSDYDSTFLLPENGQPVPDYEPEESFPDKITPIQWDSSNNIITYAKVISEQLSINTYQKRISRVAYTLFRQYLPEAIFMKRVSDALSDHISSDITWPEIGKMLGIPESADKHYKLTKNMLLLIKHGSYIKVNSKKPSQLSEAQKIVQRLESEGHSFIVDMEIKLCQYQDQKLYLIHKVLGII